MLASGYCSHCSERRSRCCCCCCCGTDRYEPSAAAFSMVTCPHHTKDLITHARSSDATQYYLHPKVFPQERHPIKLTCLLPSKSCPTNNVTHSNRLTGLQQSLEPSICAKNKHEKDLQEDYFSVYVWGTYHVKARSFEQRNLWLLF